MVSKEKKTFAPCLTNNLSRLNIPEREREGISGGAKRRKRKERNRGRKEKFRDSRKFFKHWNGRYEYEATLLFP